MHIFTAEDFENLPELIKKANPDLILWDVNLPGISGFEVCTQIRAVSEIPVIFLTSRTDSMDELTGILKGGDDYTDLQNFYSYHIYTDETDQANRWMLTNNQTAWGGMYVNKDGSPKEKEIREILGYEEVELGGREYLIHMKPRLGNELKDMAQGITATDAEIKGQAPEDLQLKLDSIERKTESEVEFLGHFIDKGLCFGSDNIVTYAAVNLVRDNLIPEVKYMLASVIIPFFYIGLVFVCVAVTVLSVQQLSDSAKHKERYEVLKKLGVGSRKIRGLVAKQLVAYYLCPALLAMVISGKMILFASGKFVLLTGVPVSAGIFFAESAALFLGIYVVYFIVTYVGFIRNIEQNKREPSGSRLAYLKSAVLSECCSLTFSWIEDSLADSEACRSYFKQFI